MGKGERLQKKKETGRAVITDSFPHSPDVAAMPAATVPVYYCDQRTALMCVFYPEALFSLLLPSLFSSHSMQRTTLRTPTATATSLHVYVCQGLCEENVRERQALKKGSQKMGLNWIHGEMSKREEREAEKRENEEREESESE